MLQRLAVLVAFLGALGAVSSFASDPGPPRDLFVDDGVAPVRLAARISPPASASTATTESLGALVESDGWCVASAVAPFDLMASVPARVTVAERKLVRYVVLRFVAGASSTRGCHQLGVALTSASPCDTLDADASGVLVDGNVVTYAVARDMDAGGLPVLSVASNVGTDGFFCAQVLW